MKRLVLCTLLLTLLCGCGFLREKSYVVVEPHNEDYGISVDSDVLTVNSYLSLKNAISNMVEDGVEEGVIRAESYSGNLSDDLSQAVYEVSELSPLGAYAVNTMTYDYSRIVSYYEIHINTTYKRTKEEIRSIDYVTDVDALRGKLQEAMETYAPKLVLRIGDYNTFDLEAEVEEITAKRVTKDVTERVTKNVTERVTKDVTKRVTKDVTENTRLLDLKNLMRNMKLTAEQAAAALEIPQAEQASLLKKL